MKYGFIKKIKEFAKNAGLYQNVENALKKYFERKNGKVFLVEDHLQAIIYSLLSNQRPWQRIERNKDNIDKIFFNYNPEKIKERHYMHFVNFLKFFSCGNRNIRKQMQGLNDIISVVEGISKTYGSIENSYKKRLVEQNETAYSLAEKMADPCNRYKLKNMGVALICEYFKNIGIDIAKPDTHIRRILGKSHLGFSSKEEADPKEAVEIIKEIAEENRITQIEVDQLLWLYCATGKGEICTKDNPRCGECVIRGWCRKGSKILT